MQHLTKIRTFTYGGSTRTLYRLAKPLTDRAFPTRWHVLKIERDGDEPSWLEAWESGEVMGYSPICAADMTEILAAA